MTILEALKQDIRFVKKPNWNPTAKLELPARVCDGWGIWCKLHNYESVLDIAIFEVTGASGSDWVPV